MEFDACKKPWRAFFVQVLSSSDKSWVCLDCKSLHMKRLLKLNFFSPFVTEISFHASRVSSYFTDDTENSCFVSYEGVMYFAADKMFYRCIAQQKPPKPQQHLHFQRCNLYRPIDEYVSSQRVWDLFFFSAQLYEAWEKLRWNFNRSIVNDGK